MIQRLYQLGISVLAAAFVMVIHELPKAIVYRYFYKGRKNKTSIWNVIQYIDPIGLIFFVTTYAGFSKPYPYLIKKKKESFSIGIIGLATLGVFVTGSLFLWRYLASDMMMLGRSQMFFLSFLRFCILYSINLCLVNLFPIVTFDMGLILSGKAAKYALSIRQNDYLLKMIVLLLMVFQVLPMIGSLILRILCF